MYDCISQECTGKLNRSCWGAVLINIRTIEDKPVLPELVRF
jgi:hypothetical protein